MLVLYRSYSVSWLVGLVLVASLSPYVQAQTTTAISANGLGTKVAELSGNRIDIGGGTRSGQNLFHSFSQFNLAAKDTANFVRPEGASNVISRVTGSQSFIDGTLQATGWTNFYFVNPNGIVFAPTAKLNIGGSAYFSTAHYLVFSDAGVFNTRSVSGGEILSSFPVSSFGFLQGAHQAPLTISGSQLKVGSGQTLSVIGGPITIDEAQLIAPNGTVQVASVGGVDSDTIVFSRREVGSGDSKDIVRDFLGYGGEVNVKSLGLTELREGSITMNPGNSFAALDAGPNGTVQTIPAPASIQTPSGSQKIVQSSLVKVVTEPVLSTISPNLTIEEGQTTTVTISLNKPAEITETVTLSNSNAGAATTAPSGPTITFNPGEQTKTIQVTGVKEGSTQITATLRNLARSAAIAVIPRLAFSGTLTSTVELGLNGTLTITLNRTSSTPTDVTLSSLTPGVATLNRSRVTIPAGETSSAPIEVTSVNVGLATIRASLNGVTVDRSMQVTPMSLGSLSGVSILEGQSGTVIVTLPRNAPSTVRVTLATSDSTIATVERAFVDIPANTNSASFTVRGVAEGSVQVRAQSGNSTQTAAVVVNALPPPPLTALAPNLSLKTGSSGSISVVLKESFKRDLTVLLRSSDPSIASVNDLVTIPANSTTSSPIVVTANRVGSTTIVASLLNSSVQALVDVTSPGVVLPPGANGTIGLSSAVQYPRAVAAPQGSVAVPRLLADKCAAVKDGQFSSFAQLNRDSAPSQPGRYLSAPTLLEGDPITGARDTVPEISIMVGPPKVLTVRPDVMSFIALAQDCRLEVK
ncbi:MAG: filamentous hemagglutinin N-terminal domain-containing protein [Nitrospira sp. CR1.1]|nr:filamentous hemagglutinin N-terminal domain-containing protein [Nitrospira sp. CR1.1]